MSRRRTWRMLVLMLMVAFAGAATPSNDEGALTVIGLRELTIAADGDVGARVRLPDIAVRYELGEAHSTTSLRVVKVMLGGTALDPATFDFTLESDEAGQPVLRATVDLSRAREAGAYAVTVKATHEGAAMPEEQLLHFTFTRPAAQLRIGTPIRIERVLPFYGRAGHLAPDNLLLDEFGGRAGMVTAQTQWLAELRGAESRPVAGRLRVSFPDTVDAWGQATAPLAIEGSLPLGTVTGTVTIRSYQLADRTLDVAVEVASRLHRVWLVVSIALGIGLGLFVREYLERRRKRTIARIAAEEQRGRLRGLIDETVDPGLGDDLRKLLAALGAAITAPRAGVASLEKAAEAAEEGIERALKEADEQRVELGTRIADMRMWLGSVEGQPHEIASLLEASLQRIADREHELTQGWIRPVRDFLDALQRDLPITLTDAVDTWLTTTEEGIKRLPRWPGTDLEKAAVSIAAEITATREHLRSDAPEHMRQLLNRTLALNRSVRLDLLTTGLSAVERLANRVLNTLESAEDPSLDSSLETLGDALVVFQGIQRGNASELPRLAEAMDTLWAAVAGALSAAVPEPDDGIDTAIRDSLREGEFERAREAVIALRYPDGERLLGASEDEATEGRRGVLPSEPELVAWTVEAHAAAWSLRIGATPSVARAGEPINLHAEIVVPQGDPAPVVQITWEVGGQPTAAGAPGNLDHQFTPRRSGSVVVRATAIDPDTGTRAAAETTFQVHPAEGFAAVRDLSRSLFWTEVPQTLIAGTLIAAAGYAIFEGTFIGTFGDILAAVLWGFSVDVGVARVREIAAPLVARTVPLPVARV